MIKKILLFIWCFPQQLISYIVRLFVKVYGKSTYKDCIVYECSIKGGSLSMGNMIFLHESQWCNEDMIKHEYGHYEQSIRLGWFSLLVITIPSMIWASCFKKYREKHNKSYYSFYTESWANKLGGVELK